jgi:hypothetical protein
MTLREKEIQRTITDLLWAEGWRVFEFEQQWSEKKRKTVGEAGMPDVMAIRYRAGERLDPISILASRIVPLDQIIWIELKRLNRRGTATKPSQKQTDWHRAERARGALTLIAGIDFPATIEGFREWYAASGLMRRKGL